MGSEMCIRDSFRDHVPWREAHYLCVLAPNAGEQKELYTDLSGIHIGIDVSRSERVWTHQQYDPNLWSPEYLEPEFRFSQEPLPILVDTEATPPPQPLAANSASGSDNTLSSWDKDDHTGGNGGLMDMDKPDAANASGIEVDP